MDSDRPETSRAFYEAILELGSLWVVRAVEVHKEAKGVEVVVEAAHEGRLPCPECGVSCQVHDRRHRRWRHLDTCQHQTILVAGTRA